MKGENEYELARVFSARHLLTDVRNSLAFQQEPENIEEEVKSGKKHFGIIVNRMVVHDAKSHYSIRKQVESNRQAHALRGVNMNKY